MPKRVLIIEDDADLSALVARHVEDLGYGSEQSRDGAEGLARAREGRFDLVILDLTLPEVDGLEICRRLRSSDRYVPILMLTARDSEIDRVLGLETGADDYLTKPFSVRELQARIRALLRRVDALADQAAHRPASFTVGDMSIDESRRSVRVAGRAVELTAKEFDLLVLFARNPGRVFSRAQLLKQVWGYAHKGYDHTVNSHINRLRHKIEPDPANPRYLLTVWGVGYRFFEPRDTEGPGGA